MFNVFSDDGKRVGIIEKSDCGNSRRLCITHEPYRTQVSGVLTDYALETVYGEHSYRLQQEKEAWVVQARSLLEDNLFVPIATLEPLDDGDYTFSLVRIRPQYKRHKERRIQVQDNAAEQIIHLPAGSVVGISACLLGESCRYDGKAKGHAPVQKLAAHWQVIPLCPEVAGGLPIPREPAEIQGSRIRTETGTDMTEAFRKGAEKELEKLQQAGAQYAILKTRSPSCGIGQIYDGSFSHRLKAGNGIFAETCIKAGMIVAGEEDFQ